jgi:hypothetical protein
MPREANVPWHERPWLLAGIVVVVLVILNAIFW